MIKKIIIIILRSDKVVKIAVVQSTEFLKLRLTNIIRKSGFESIDVNEENLKGTYNYDPIFKSANLIVFDLDNKEFDIFAIVKSIRESINTSSIPIIVLSSQADFRMLKKVIEVGANDFLTKPFSSEKFMEKIYKHASNVKFTILKTTYKDEDVDVVPDNVKFEWNKEFELGLSEIDEEHHRIVDNFEKLYTYMKEGKGHEYYLELVDFLNDYVDNHFLHEEEYQQRIAYDKIKEHKLIHEDFKEKVREIIAASKTHEINNMDLIKLNLFIKDWLINHILIEDRKLADFVESKKEESK